MRPTTNRLLLSNIAVSESQAIQWLYGRSSSTNLVVQLHRNPRLAIACGILEYVMMKFLSSLTNPSPFFKGDKDEATITCITRHLLPQRDCHNAHRNNRDRQAFNLPDRLPSSIMLRHSPLLLPFRVYNSSFEPKLRVASIIASIFMRCIKASSVR